jgi:hypothetical protein
MNNSGAKKNTSTVGGPEAVWVCSNSSRAAVGVHRPGGRKGFRDADAVLERGRVGGTGREQVFGTDPDAGPAGRLSWSFKSPWLAVTGPEGETTPRTGPIPRHGCEVSESAGP